MRTAVMRIAIDPRGVLSPTRYDEGVARLRSAGFDVLASPAEHLPEMGREIELVIQGLDLADRELYLEHCSQAFGIASASGVVTYISRGTDEDARGVLDAFGIGGNLERATEGDDEVVTVTLCAPDARRVPESRLHTALEAALNCEVRIVRDT